MKKTNLFSITLWGTLLVTLVALGSCKKDNLTPRASFGADTSTTLANVTLLEGETIAFKEDKHGVFLIVKSEGDVPEVIEVLKGKSLLESFLCITDNKIPVPEALLGTEDPDIARQMIGQRSVVQSLRKPVRAITNRSAELGRAVCGIPARPANWCSPLGAPFYFDHECNEITGNYTDRMYSLMPDGTVETHFGSYLWKQNGTLALKCAEMEILAVNCQTPGNIPTGPLEVSANWNSGTVTETGYLYQNQWLFYKRYFNTYAYRYTTFNNYSSIDLFSGYVQYRNYYLYDTYN